MAEVLSISGCNQFLRTKSSKIQKNVVKMICGEIKWMMVVKWNIFLSSPKLFSDSKAKIIKNSKKVSGNISVLKMLSIQRYHKFNSIESWSIPFPSLYLPFNSQNIYWEFVMCLYCI